MTINYNNDDSVLRTQMFRDRDDILSKYKLVLATDIMDYDSPNAAIEYTSSKTGRVITVSLIGSDINLLRHAISNYDDVMAILDDRASRNNWTFKYKKNVYDLINRAVQTKVYNFLIEWRESLHKRHCDLLFKTTQSSMSKAGVLKNELKALVKKVLNNGDVEYYANKLNSKYRFINR